MFLKSFEYFRGISILFIVAGHCFQLGNWEINNVFEKFIANIIAGGSSLFVFISGFLFHHVFFKKYKYERFIFKKIRNVLIPYLVLSVLPIIYFVFIKGGGPHVDYMQLDENKWLLSVLFYIFSGSTLTAYWYVPFIMVVFFLSPLFISFIEANRKKQIIITIFFVFVSLVLHRPSENVNVFQSVLYFTPFYLIGILSSINKDTIFSRFPKIEWLLLGGVFMFALLQAIFYDHYGNFHKNIFEFSNLDIMLIQKLLLCLFCMTFLRRFENVKCSSLSFLATISFPIYFIHPQVITVLSKFIASKDLYHDDPGGPSLWLLSTLIVLAISIFFAVIVKKCIPKYSRQLIGW
jgi:surface polysaccharide O-acyltransferase-like enzyme